MRQELKMLTVLRTGFGMDWLADGLAVPLPQMHNYIQVLYVSEAPCSGSFHMPYSGCFWTLPPGTR